MARSLRASFQRRDGGHVRRVLCQAPRRRCFSQVPPHHHHHPPKPSVCFLPASHWLLQPEPRVSHPSRLTLTFSHSHVTRREVRWGGVGWRWVWDPANQSCSSPPTPFFTFTFFFFFSERVAGNEPELLKLKPSLLTRHLNWQTTVFKDSLNSKSPQVRELMLRSGAAASFLLCISWTPL